MQSRILTLIPVAILLFVFALPGSASLVGSSVTGSLTFSGDPSNYFDPGYGFVPVTGYLNASGTTVTVSDTKVEFGYDDGANLLSADFTHNQLTVSDAVKISGSNSSFQMMFTDVGFANQHLIPVSATLPLVDTYSVVGDVITLTFPGGNVTLGQTLTASFTVAPVPEPSTFGCLCLSLVAALGTFVARSLRRRLLQS